MNRNINIAIDGPSGAGKSSLAKMLATILGFIYLDTGAMYRAIGVKVYRSGVEYSDTQAINKILDQTHLEIKYSSDTQRIYLDGEDVSEAIREHHISKIASDVSALPSVRLKMVELQREIAAKNNCILDGRDIGTYVLPNADYKFYLTADLDVRAKRRYDELIERGMTADLKNIEKDIAQRDYNDMNRDFAPLKQADDAILIDSSNLDREQTCEVFLSHLSSIICK